MKHTLSINDKVSQVPGHIVSDMDGEKVMLSVKNGKYYNLGEVGGAIWESIRETSSVQQVIQSMIIQYDVDHEDCRHQVIDFIGNLLEEGLVNVESA